MLIKQRGQKKAKDKYENSFLCADKRKIVFTAFGVKIRGDDLDKIALLNSATSATSLLQKEAHVLQ